MKLSFTVVVCIVFEFIAVFMHACMHGIREAGVRIYHQATKMLCIRIVCQKLNCISVIAMPSLQILLPTSVYVDRSNM